MSAAGFLAALSISSLASDHGDDLDPDEVHSLAESDYAHHMRLFDQHRTAGRTLQDDSHILKRDVPSFINVESGSAGSTLRLSIPLLGKEEVLCVTALCLPAFVIEEDLICCAERRRLPGEDFSALRFSLSTPEGVQVKVRPQLLNGEYSFALLPQHLPRGGGGSYLLQITSEEVQGQGVDEEVLFEGEDEEVQGQGHGVQGQGVRNQGVRVCWTVRAAPPCCTSLLSGRAVRGGAPGGCYRVALKDPGQRMLTVLLHPLGGAEGEEVQQEVLVSARFEGLAGVCGRADAQWACTSSGVQILPSDPLFCTPEEVRLRHFAVEVRSSTPYEVTATAEEVPPVTALSAVSSRTPFRTSFSSSAPTSSGVSYFSLRIDPAATAQEVHVCVASAAGGGGGRGIKASSPSPALGTFTAEGVAVSEGLAPFSTEEVQQQTEAEGCCEEVLVIYLSATVPFPGPRLHSWKAFGSAAAAFALRPSAFRYLSSRLYFAVHRCPCTPQGVLAKGSRIWDDFLLAGIDPAHLAIGGGSAGAAGGTAGTLTLSGDAPLTGSVTVTSSAPSTSEAVFEEVFEGVHGGRLSHRDRAALALGIGTMPSVSVDEPSLAYGELSSCTSLQDLLRGAGAADGMVFVDLGCGTGRAMVAAALSGVAFLRVCGYEVLPLLADAAEEVLLGRLTALATEGVLPLLEVRREDCLLEDCDWAADADIAFAACTCFSEPAMHRLFAATHRMRAGAKLLTAKVPDAGYDARAWALEGTGSCDMSWGLTEFLILRRLPHQQEGEEEEEQEEQGAFVRRQ